MILQPNGFIIQRYKEVDYKGIEGDNWFDVTDNYFREYIKNNIEMSWNDSMYVDCCCDINFLRRYCDEAVLEKIPFRILFCSTNRPNPLFIEKEFFSKRFLGFDYAFAGGSYYSAIRNELFRIREFMQFETKLNNNFLFDKYEILKEFINKRGDYLQERIKHGLGCTFDNGYIENADFTVYELYECRVEQILEI